MASGEPRRRGPLGDAIAMIKARRRKIRRVENAQRKAAHIPRRKAAEGRHARKPKRGQG